MGWLMKLERQGETFTVDASVLGELLDVPASDVQSLMRENKITCLCEHGEAEHAGRHRLTFFYKGRRGQLIVDESGRLLRHSIIELGSRARSPATERPADS
jgi:hypothetical protein